MFTADVEVASFIAEPATHPVAQTFLSAETCLMFTGIVEEVGTVADLTTDATGGHLRITCAPAGALWVAAFRSEAETLSLSKGAATTGAQQSRGFSP